MEDEESTPIEIISTKGMISPSSATNQAIGDYPLSGGSSAGIVSSNSGGVIDPDAINSRNNSAPVTPATTKGKQNSQASNELEDIQGLFTYNKYFLLFHCYVHNFGYCSELYMHLKSNHNIKN